ncbi:MAG: FAD-dependent thymidylate synthase [Sphaerochaetaceae bacterium]
MAFEVKIIADSVNQGGDRITTLQLKYPRFIHAEFMTHREFSRNASSSRAIPVAKMIEAVREDPAMPIHWGVNQPGMQAHAELDSHEQISARFLWRKAANLAADRAEEMLSLNLHKQVVNRILEPYQWMSVVMTTTNLQNFFHLRCHKDAQPEIKYLADMMHSSYNKQKPLLLLPGEWHLPYITDVDRELVEDYCQISRVSEGLSKQAEITELLKRISAARCARVSYLTHDGVAPDITKDIELFDRLVGSSPLHASPTEHQATPDLTAGSKEGYSEPHLHGNFTGWVQHRKTLPGEYVV